MQTNNYESVQQEKSTTSLIHKLQNIPLSNVPFHQNAAFIKRLFNDAFPVYIAVHEVSPVIETPAEYTQPHLHNEWSEVNIILSPKNLIYKIQLGFDEHIVSNNTSIFIPKGMIHSANVLHGEGYFITMRMN